MGHLYHGKLLNNQMITTQERGGFPLGHGGFVTEDAVSTTLAMTAISAIHDRTHCLRP